MCNLNCCQQGINDILYMRIKIMLLVLLLTGTKLLAQENKSYLVPAKVKHGSILIGGATSAAIYKTTKEISKPLSPEEGTNIQLSLDFKGGYFILHDFVVGLETGFTHESLSVEVDGVRQRFRQTMLLGGPFTRYYLDNGVFGELILKAGLLNISSGSKTNLAEGKIGIGYAYFINEKISLEPVLHFRYFREWEGGQTNTTLGPMVSFGVQAYLLRKRSHIIKEAL